MKLIVTTVEYDDGESTTDLFQVSDETLISQLSSLINKLPKKTVYNLIVWGSGDYLDSSNNPRVIYKDILSEEDISFIELFLPNVEHGFEYITVMKIVDEVENLI